MNQQELWDKKWGQRANELGESDFARQCIKSIKSTGANSILDVGCGDGKDSIFFAKNGLTVAAVDFSSKALDFVKKRMQKEGVNNISLIHSDMVNLTVNKKFDCIYANLSLHYFDDKTTSKIFQKLFSLLYEQGMLFIRCRSVNDHLYGEGEEISKDIFLRDGHIRHFFSEVYMEEKLLSFSKVEVKEKTAIHHKLEGGTYHSVFIEAVAQK